MLASLRRADPYLIELGGGLLLLAAVNVLLLPGDPGFLGVQPNPTLALVVVLACRHGLRAGLVSGFVTASAIAACVVARMGPTGWSELRGLSHYVTPLLLIGSGLGLGVLRESELLRASVLGAKVGGLEQELADQAVRFMAATEAKHELERRVAD